MSRSYDAGREAIGEWRDFACDRCAGDNQRSDGSKWWFGNAKDMICTLCRCEVEAEQQQAWDEEHRKVLEQEALHEEWLLRIEDEARGPTKPKINYNDIPF